MLAMAVVGFLSLYNPVVSERDGGISVFSSSLFSNPAVEPYTVVASSGYISGFGYIPFYVAGSMQFKGFDLGAFLKGMPTSMEVYLSSGDLLNPSRTFVGEFALGVSASKKLSLSFMDLRAGASLAGFFGRAYRYSSFGGGASLGAVASVAKLPLRVSVKIGPLGYASSYAGEGGYFVASSADLGLEYSLVLGALKISPQAGFSYRFDGQVSIPVGVAVRFSSLPLVVSLSSEILSTEYAYAALSYITPLEFLGGKPGVSLGGSYSPFGFSSTVSVFVK